MAGGLGVSPRPAGGVAVGVTVQVVIDCRDPNALAGFWADVLGYHKQWDCAEDPVAPWCAVVDPEGRGPRLVFQRVSETKAAKNRVHLDLQVGQDRAPEEVRRLVGLGA